MYTFSQVECAAVMAGVVFQHPSIEALIRELSRNLSLLQVCGFESTVGTPELSSKAEHSFGRCAPRLQAAGRVR